MGVKSLWQILENAGYQVDLEELQGKKVAIDTSIWLTQLAIGMVDKQGYKLRNPHLLGLFLRICKLMHYGIYPVFVFEGQTPALKRQTVYQRRSRRALIGKRAHDLQIKSTAQRLLREVLASKKRRLAHEEEEDISSFPLHSPLSTPESLSLPDQPSCSSDQHTDASVQLFKSPSSSDQLVFEESDEYEEEEEEGAEEDESELEEWMQNLEYVDEAQIDSEPSLGPMVQFIEAAEGTLDDEEDDSIFEPNPSMDESQSHSERIHELSSKSASEFSNFQLQALIQRGANVARAPSRFDPSNATRLNLDGRSVTHFAKQSISHILPFFDVTHSEKFSQQRQPDIPDNSQPLADQAVGRFLAMFGDHTSYSAARDRNSTDPSNLELSLASDEEQDLQLISGDDEELQLLSDEDETLSSIAKENDGCYLLVDDGKQYDNQSNTQSIEVHQPMLVSAERHIEFQPIPPETNAEELELISGDDDDDDEVEKEKEKFGSESKEILITLPTTNGTSPIHQILLTPIQSLEEQEKHPQITLLSNQKINLLPPANAIENRVELQLHSIPLLEDQYDSSDDSSSLSSSPTPPFADSSRLSSNPTLSSEHLLVINTGSSSDMTQLTDASNVSFDEAQGSSLQLAESPESQEPKIDRLSQLLEWEQRKINQETRQLEKHLTTSRHEDITEECIALLDILGVPYLIAPYEAEAQCAALNRMGLVDAIISDDSDCFLFGAQVVYRKVFSQNGPEKYRAADIESKLGLSRKDLIDLALLLGCDYGNGIAGVGPVSALEVLASWQSTEGDTLARWKAHLDAPEVVSLPEDEQDGQSEVGTTQRTAALRTAIPDSFPSHQVRQAFWDPFVTQISAPFSWKKPDLASLKHFINTELTELSTHHIEMHLATVQRWNHKPQTQLSIRTFFQQPKSILCSKSQRMNQAFKTLVLGKNSIH